MKKVVANLALAIGCVASVHFVVSLSGMFLAAGTPEQRQACMQDAFRLCNTEVPEVERITACMAKNIHKLSDPCRAQFSDQKRHPVRERTLDW